MPEKFTGHLTFRQLEDGLVIRINTLLDRIKLVISGATDFEYDGGGEWTTLMNELSDLRRQLHQLRELVASHNAWALRFGDANTD